MFAYDRPGYGSNPASNTPRDPCTIATELRDQLRSAGLPPPYVLVGHSLGGLYQYVFARLYPEVRRPASCALTRTQLIPSIGQAFNATYLFFKSVPAMSAVTFSTTERRI
ncbi:MAG: alpha/beta hydrolase [Dechloromonas sp.]|uniref:Alpha/beta hydrolase n=1 Tax=Candidatus Dechloromonas phosphorivorans TaxID=2899244 RepID=A0A935KF09_9RHOO|nr:alpha/beta hydrolase [Candidatus Dechloromonas phosphorivorans]